MNQMSQTKGTKNDYFEMYKDVWAFHKKYIEKICARDEYWQAVVADADVIVEKYGNCKFMRDLIFAEITEFERIYKKRSEAS